MSVAMIGDSQVVFMVFEQLELFHPLWPMDECPRKLVQQLEDLQPDLLRQDEEGVQKDSSDLN